MAEEITARITWHFPEWITFHGGLNPDNVMDYFSESPFWDNTSNNATLKMQTQFNTLQASNLNLKAMTGIEFELVYERWPTLFIILKQRRRSPTESIPMVTYYILDSVVHQAPDLYSIIANRMLTSLYHLRSAFNDATKHVRFHPAIGYTWKTNKDEDDDGGLASDEQPLSPSIGEKGGPCASVVTDDVDSPEASHTETELLGFRTRVDHLILNASRIAEMLRDRDVEGEKGPESSLFAGETSTGPALPGSRMGLTLATVEEALSFVETPTSPQKDTKRGKKGEHSEKKKKQKKA